MLTGSHGGRSSARLERQVVALEVGGSSPLGHPTAVPAAGVSPAAGTRYTSSSVSPGRHVDAPLAQLAEHRTLNPQVLGSSPRGRTTRARIPCRQRDPSLLPFSPSRSPRGSGSQRGSHGSQSAKTRKRRIHAWLRRRSIAGVEGPNMAKNTRRANGNADPLWNEQRQRYELFLELPRSEDGKRRRKKVSGKTKTEARQHAREVRQSVDATGEATDDSITVAVMMRGFLDAIPGTVSEGTLQIYRRADRLCITPALGREKVAHLQPRDVTLWLNSVRGENDRRLSPATLRQARAVLRRALRWAQNEGMTTRNDRRDRTGPPGRVQGRAATRAGTGAGSPRCVVGIPARGSDRAHAHHGAPVRRDVRPRVARPRPRRRSADAHGPPAPPTSRRCRPGARRTQDPRLAAVARAAPHGGRRAPSSMGRTERGTSPARRSATPTCRPFVEPAGSAG